MILKRASKRNLVLIQAQKLFSHTLQNKHITGAKIFIGLAIFVSIAILGVYSSFQLSRYVLANEDRYKRLIKPILTENIRIPFNYIKGLTTTPKQITIDIKYEDFQKLAYQRDAAMAKQLLVVGDEDYVPATIRHNDKSVKVKLRLKGDGIDHLRGDKWSFRIIVKGDNTFWGMKQFSVHNPKTRNYLYEWLFHQALKRENILSLRYEFIQVILNGKDLGIYALEEHFEKRLIEHNQLREGPIVRFNENLMWEEHQQQALFNAKTNKSGSYLSSDTDTFQTNKMLSDPSVYSQYIKAINLLESFRRGQLKTSDVFDVQKLARFFALTDLMGAEHGARWHNARFYYNPTTSRLEPIGFDAHCGAIESLMATMEVLYIGDNPPEIRHNYYAMIFNDEVFFTEYIKALERVSEPSYLNEFLAEFNDALKQNLRIIYREFPHFRFSTGTLYRNQRYIKTVLRPIKGVHAYYHQSLKDQITLELGNIQSMPIEVLSVSYKDSLQFQPAQKTILPAKHERNPVDYRAVRFTFPEGFVWSDSMTTDLRLNYKLLGSRQVRQETVFPWSHLSHDFLEDDFIRQPPNAHEFAFLVIDESTKTISIKPGRWNLDRNLIIPKGYRVIGSEGVQLNLSNSATILSYSSLSLVGSEVTPITIHSVDSTGQGVVVLGASDKSILEYVHFKNLSNPSQSGWELTGAVTFYESPVNISHCQFVGNRSEDGLNIIRSGFKIDKSLFDQTFSDAFDADFTKGKITNSSFVACGNDAIDVSGSVITIEKVFINNAGDKGLSAGENSSMTVDGVEIINAEIGVASKDSSKIAIEDMALSHSKIGFTVYQKKPEFGSASLAVNRLRSTKIDLPYLVEEHSTLIVDGTEIKANRRNVAEILYGVEYGKSSK